jgi:hypothetical protein
MEKSNTPGIQPKIFILFFLVGLLPLAVGSIILLSGARETYQEVVSSHLSVLAENAQMEVNGYLRNAAKTLDSLALTPEIRFAVDRSNQMRDGPSPAQIESGWAAMDPQKPGFLKDLLDNPASRYLREYSFESAFREIIVTDAQGRLAAATNKTSDYYQADEKWWNFAYREGAGGHFVGDILFDESAGIYAMDVAMPVMDRVTRRALGVVKAIIEVEELVNLVKSIKVGEQGQALLLRGDSVILVSSEATFRDQRRFKYFNDVRSAIQNGERAIMVGTGDQRFLIGLPQFRMKDSLPELDWYLTVQQPRDEALAIFRNINTRFLYILLFTVLVVVFLSFFVSWYLSKPLIEVDPHLEQL